MERHSHHETQKEAFAEAKKLRDQDNVFSVMVCEGLVGIGLTLLVKKWIVYVEWEK
jgi:hypothetical protein